MNYHHGFSEEQWQETDYIIESKKEDVMEKSILELKLLELKLAEYRDMKTELAFPLEKLSKLEKEIRDLVKTTGEVAEIDGARIKVIRPKNPRVRWNTKALEGFAAAHPELQALREEYWPSPSVRIEVD